MTSPQDLPSKSNDNPFIENAEDPTGYLALMHYLLSVKEPRVQEFLSQVVSSSSESDVVVFRAFAKQCLDRHIHRVVENRIELARDAIYQSTYQDIMKSNHDVLVSEQKALLAEQRADLERILSSVEESSGTFRQIVVAFIASLVFGVIISLAQLIDSPFKSSPVQQKAVDSQLQSQVVPRPK